MGLSFLFHQQAVPHLAVPSYGQPFSLILSTHFWEQRDLLFLVSHTISLIAITLTRVRCAKKANRQRLHENSIYDDLLLALTEFQMTNLLIL